MKKFRNDPDRVMDETMEGYMLANGRRLCLPEGTHNMMRRVPKKKGLVKLVVGNGGGHEPGLMGWIGLGLYDLDCLGNVFTAQSGKTFYKGIKALDDGSPILLTVANHAGDVTNGNLAYSLCLDDDMDVRKVLFYDDIASAPKGRENERRGMAGMFFAIKAAGAMAEEGGTLEECARVFEKARDNVRTLAIALTSCTHPVTGMTMMSTPENEVNIGAGVHGEGGAGNIPFATSAELMRKVSDLLIEDLPFRRGDEIVLLVNGMGSTTMMELSIATRDVRNYLATRGISVLEAVTGNFVTTQEMGGLSLSFLRLDEELKRLWNAPADSPAYSNLGMR